MIAGAECDFFKRKQAPAGEDELVGGELALALAGAERVCERVRMTQVLGQEEKGQDECRTWSS